MTTDTIDDGAGVPRRTFVTGVLASGFALAVQPVAAGTIITDAAGLEAGNIKIKASDGKAVPGYRAHPLNAPHAPVILVVQEIFGLHEHIKDICRRLAKVGYYAIAPELFSRDGDATKVADAQQIISTIVSKVPDAQALSDLDSAVAFAREDGGNTGKLGITGFCWGGRMAWLYAEHNPDLKAAVAWYGFVAGRKKPPLQPHDPIDQVADLKAPVLGLYGAADTGIPQDSLHRMEDLAKAAGKPVSIVVYPDTPHAFNADYRPSYREGPAKDGWKRMLDWFKTHGL